MSTSNLRSAGGGMTIEEQMEADGPLTLIEYTQYLDEIEQQPGYRKQADREMDYADGNQLDSELLKAQQEQGIPPAKDDRIGPAMLALQGYEATVRTDWRVTPNGQPGGQDVADALNCKLNEAERHSKADIACTGAFRSQVGVGIGWVEVARESDPFKYPYRCTTIHRNEIAWDFAAGDDLSDARYLRRTRWLHPSRLAKTFPKHKKLIAECGRNGSSWWGQDGHSLVDGGASTGLETGSWDSARGWTVAENRWYNSISKELCLVEMWYRRWVNVIVLKTPDGRVVEYDKNNPAHNYALATGASKPTQATVSRVRRSYWIGPHCLHDGPSPYAHNHFPYVPFFGFREDGTRVPYGYIRGMMFQQDRLNSGIAMATWGMTAYRIENTKGAVDMTDAQLRRQAGRRNAHIVLNAAAMSQPGARFEIKRDVQLTDQQIQMMNDARASIESVSAAPSAFTGRQGTATSGKQEQTQVEQANQSLGLMMSNFRAARSMVGELLLSMIVEDLGDKPHTVVIEGDAVTEDRTVVINKPEVDPENGYTYLSNDLQRTRLMVALEDVPSSASYRGQQLNAMSEAVKSLPAQYQAAAMPFLASLMDVPFKRKLVEALRAAGEQESPEQIEQRIAQAVQDALAKSGVEVKMREIALKEKKGEAEIEMMMRQAVQIGVQTAFSAMSTGVQVAQMPMIAPVADKVMQANGWRPAPGGVDPNIPTASTTAAMNIASPYVQGQGPELAAEEAAGATTQVRENTSPQFPPIPPSGASPMTGIETSDTADNLQGA